METFKLKNASDEVILDKTVHDFILEHNYLNQVRFIENLRRHSYGYAFFQKNRKTSKGNYACETIYLHRFIADTFLVKPQTVKRLCVRFANGNPLDCRLSNLEWTSLAQATRNTDKSWNKFGYRGVVQDKKRFRAVIYQDRKPINLGTFKTPEEAAEAYNQKSLELFGRTRSLNVIKK